MSYHRIVKCPRCGDTAENIYSVLDETLYGSPYRICRECGAAYFDPFYHELAIDAFNDKGALINIWGILWLLAVNGLLVWLITLAGHENSAKLWIPFIIVLCYACILDFQFIITLQSKLNAEEYHQEQIDVLEGRIGEMSDELAESMKRVSDRKYLDALRSHRVDVPEYFYKRLGSREGNFVEPEGVVEINMLNVKEIKNY